MKDANLKTNKIEQKLISVSNNDINTHDVRELLFATWHLKIIFVDELFFMCSYKCQT